MNAGSIALIISVSGIFASMIIYATFTLNNMPSIKERYCFIKEENTIEKVVIQKVVKDKRHCKKYYIVSTGFRICNNYREFEVDELFRSKKRCEKKYLNERIDFINRNLYVHEQMINELKPKNKKGGKKNALVRKPTYKKSKS